MRLPLPSSAVFCLACVLPAQAAKVYFVNQPENLAGEIRAVNPDGTGGTTLYTTPAITDLRGIAVNPVTQRLFFVYSLYTATSTSTGIRTEVSLRGMPAAGGVPETFLTFPDESFITDIEWDPAGWLYYADTGNYQLRRIRPDGTGDALVLTHLPAAAGTAGQGPYFFGLDLPQQTAYWGVLTESGDTGTRYSRGTLAGTLDPAFVLTTPTRTRDIAVDSAAQRLYWCDRQDGNLYTRAVSGGAVTAVRAHRTFNAPHGLALDLEAGKAYVADTGKRGSASEASSHRVVRFNLDGSGALEFLSPVSPVAEPWDVTLDMTSTSYADWKTRFFASTAAATGMSDDFDSDGLTNAAEYAFCTRPHQKGDLLPLSALPGAIRYARRLDSDVPLRVEVSTDLITWHWNDDTPGAVWSTETDSAPRDEDSAWITARPAGPLAAAPRVYFRLRAIY